MPRKKKEEEIEETQGETATEETTEENAVETKSNEAETAEENTESETVKTEDAAAESAETAEPSLLESIAVTIGETVAGAVNAVAGTAADVVETVVEAISPNGDETKKTGSSRAERVGVVASDKMTKTVTVRVDRVVKHPTYRKYIRRRKKFMAHDELGAAIGDKVRIIETRPLSAKKRWRVVEIIQKAEK